MKFNLFVWIDSVIDKALIALNQPKEKEKTDDNPKSN